MILRRRGRCCSVERRAAQGPPGGRGRGEWEERRQGKEAGTGGEPERENRDGIIS